MEKRMAGDYEIIHAFHIGDKEIVIGENVNTIGDERYMCAYCDRNEIFGLYNDLWCSDDFCEVVNKYAERLSEQAEKTRRELRTPILQGIDITPVLKAECTPVSSKDDYHFETQSPGFGNLYHICEFAERYTERGCQGIIPLRSSLPEKCFSYLESTGEMIVITKGEKGYIPTGASGENMTPREAVDAANKTIGVTKAQEAAMVAGSMFGWQVPNADPKNYDEQGLPIRPKPKEREDAR